MKKQYAMTHRPEGGRTPNNRQSTLGDYLHINDDYQNDNELITKVKGKGTMKLKDFYVLVANKEGKKKQTSIGNIREVLKVTNDVISKKSNVKDALYKMIRKL